MRTHRSGRQPRENELSVLLRSGEGLVCPGVTNPLYAMLAERHGFSVVYVTGAGVANVSFGVPDLGLVTMTEMLTETRRICDQVSLPVIADIDTGFGGASQVARTVREFASAGVSAVQIEDQVNPKRCGHIAGTEVVSLGEMTERLVAAREAADETSTLIIARTDARQSEGLAAAIRRSEHYVECGADILFVEAPQSVDELKAVATSFEVPTIANMVEGGRTPLLPAVELFDMGFGIVLYANAISRLATAAVQRGLAELRRVGDTSGLLDQMVNWEQRQSLVDLDGYQAVEAGILARANLRFGQSSAHSH